MSIRKRPLYAELASLLSAQENCRKANNAEWLDKHGASIKTLVDWLPSGSGIDTGTRLDDSSTPERLVFTFSYHHMNDGGYYDGWTDHVLTVRASLLHGIDITVSGRNRNEIKDYLHETYHYALTQDVWQDDEGNWVTGMFSRPAV